MNARGTPMTPTPLRKVVIVNTADEGGGAERMAMAILEGFTALGTEAWLLVGDKRTGQPRVMPLHLSPFFDYRPYAGAWRQALLERRRRLERWLGLEDLVYPYAHHLLDLTGTPPDLVLGMNLHGGYFDLRALVALSQRVPVVLGLSDSWLLTGHCANPLGCSRWERGCGRCPDLTLPPAIRRDATRLNWWRKRRVFRRARVFATCPSRWMLDRTRRSILAPAVREWRLIPGGVDLDTFSPGPRGVVRQALGLAPDAHVVLFVANLGSTNPFKNFPAVRRAVEELARRGTARPLELIVVGSAGPEERVAPTVAIRHVGSVRSSDRLAAFYRAADLLVHAAVEEPFGLSVAEAMACGTPVVTAGGGGVLEVVESGRTGLVVPPGDPHALAGALAALLEDPSRRAAMGAAATAAARARLGLTAMVRALHEWCAEIVARWLVESAGSPFGQPDLP